LARYPKSAFADDATWYLTFAYYLLGDSTEALKAIATYAEIAGRSNEDAVMRVRYWRARILMQAGRSDDAKPLLRECVSHAPFHYYGLLARARLREMGESPSWPQGPGRASEPAPLQDPAWRAHLSSIVSGLKTKPASSSNATKPAFSSATGRLARCPFCWRSTHDCCLSPAHKLAEANGQAELGEARDSSGRPRIRVPSPALPRLRPRVRQPGAFRVRHHEEGIELLSLRRFLLGCARPSATDSVHGRRGGPALILGPIPTSSSTPIPTCTSAQPTWASSSIAFSGQEALAAGAYNAGAHAMMRWCDQWGNRPLDEFVELITYDQAREYIKRVLGIYARYRHLYAQPLELSLDP